VKESHILLYNIDVNFVNNRILKLFPLAVILFMIFVSNVQCSNNKTIHSKQQQPNQVISGSKFKIVFSVYRLVLCEPQHRPGL
jgi:hypothetical protein